MRARRRSLKRKSTPGYTAKRKKRNATHNARNRNRRQNKSFRAVAPQCPRNILGYPIRRYPMMSPKYDPIRERDATIIAHLVALVHARSRRDYVTAATAHKELVRFGVLVT